MGHFSCAGRTFSRTGICDVATLKPTTPLQPLMQTNVKPRSPLLAPVQQPLKPPSPLQPKNTPKTPISHPQRRRRFQLGLSLREQRRRRFHARDLRCPRAMVGPGCGGRGRWRGLAGLRDDAPSEARSADGERAGRRCGGRKRARLRRPRAMVGPGRGAGGWRQGQGGPRDRPLRAQLACGDLAGGPPPTGTHSGRALRRPEHPWGREQAGPTSQATRRPEIRRGHKQREYPRQA